MAGLTVHKLDSEEVNSIRGFIQASELMLESDKYSRFSPFDKYEDLDDEDEDKIKIEGIRKRIAKEEDIRPQDVDGRIVAYEYLKFKYTHRLPVVLLNATILIDNCCDPLLDYLAYRPSLTEIHVAPEQ